MSTEAAAQKRFEVGQLFTPSTPIKIVDLFAGRQRQLFSIVDTIAERGRHILLYGERGVGKTSIAQIVPYVVPSAVSRVRFIRIQCFPNDTFSTIARKLFKQIHFSADIGDGDKTYDVAQIYPGQISPDDFLLEFEQTYDENDVPIIVIDEFNEITDKGTAGLFANLLKALSDSGSNVTIVIVGVADNVDELIENHASVQRCTEEIHMQRMTSDELKEALEKRLEQLGFTISPDAKWKIINLAKGLPSYVHSLGKFSCFKALEEMRMNITEADVDAAIDSLLQSSQQTLKQAHATAIRSNQPGNLFEQVLTACALAKADDSGFFTPVAVKAPLSAILGKNVEIANFQNHLKDFAGEKRGRILHRTGEERSYRFRFREPAMQPFVIMKGIRDAIIDEKARQALSYPEQPELFAIES